MKSSPEPPPASRKDKSQDNMFLTIDYQSSKILLPYIFPNCCLAFPSALMF